MRGVSDAHDRLRNDFVGSGAGEDENLCCADGIGGDSSDGDCGRCFRFSLQRRCTSRRCCVSGPQGEEVILGDAGEAEERGKEDGARPRGEGMEVGEWLERRMEVWGRGGVGVRFGVEGGVDPDSDSESGLSVHGNWVAFMSNLH